MDAYRTERVGDLIVQVLYDEDGSLSDPRDNDNLAHIYGSHRRYVIADGEPPADEMRALERGGIRLLYRWLRRYQDVVAFTKLGMLDHSGVTYYAVPLNPPSAGHHVMDPGGWDSGIVGYAYVTRADLARDGGNDEADAERVMLSEVKEYGQWAAGEVYGYAVTRPCADDHHEDDDDTEVADCPHSEVIDSCWGYIGDPDYVWTDAVAAAQALAVPA